MNFNELLKNDPVYRLICEHRKNIVTFIWLAVILLFAGFVRINTFWLPHWMGDQVHYVSLAMKLDKLGFKYYNLRGLDVGFIDFDQTKTVRIIYPRIDGDSTGKGRILGALDTVGITYYDQPIFHKAPGFSYLILLSHKLFAKNKDLYTIVFSLRGDYVTQIKPPMFFEAQFYAVVIPYAFSLGLVVLSFILGRMLFSDKIGLYAAAMLAINPVSIMTSQKLWTDDMLSFFVMTAAMLFLHGLRSGKIVMFFLAGIACGLSVLAKQTGGYLCYALGWYTLIEYLSSMKIKKIPGIFYDKRLWLFAIGLIIVTAFWFFRVYQVYGDPRYLPGQENIANSDVTGWFKQLYTRPNSYVVFSVVTIIFCPPFALALLSLKDLALNLWGVFTKRTQDTKFIFLWTIIVVFYFLLTGNREERMFLPVYPIIAVLSGYYLDKLSAFISRTHRIFANRAITEALIVLGFIITACWTVPIGIKTGIEQTILLKIPFF